ncbi:MAG: hypothetical protein Q4E07_06440 [Eubacteriales bacterium]|nr:hypothetical protein [Eubacteriales bacterium]
MTVTVNNGNANFEIYGFPYYVVPANNRRHRGLKVNNQDLINKENADFETAITKIFESLDGRYERFPKPQKFTLGGVLEPFTDRILALNAEDRILALKALAGFDGKEGYDTLLNYPGFSEEEIAPLRENHVDFTARIRKNIYPYRVLQFYFEEEDSYEYYNERYAFVKTQRRDWILIRVATEYNIDYAQRTPYIHGLSGSNVQDLKASNDEASQGFSFETNFDTVLQATGGTPNKKGNAITVKDSSLYRMPADITYSFDDNKLYKVKYTFSGSKSFFSAFVSLYVRYYDPLIITIGGETSWFLEDMIISLKWDSKKPTLTFEQYLNEK